MEKVLKFADGWYNQPLLEKAQDSSVAVTNANPFTGRLEDAHEIQIKFQSSKVSPAGKPGPV